MINISIQHDIDKALVRMAGYRNQMPFALANTINKTAEDVQQRLRSVTFTKSVKSRNKALPSALSFIRNVDRAKPNKLIVKIGPAMGRKGRYAGAGFAVRQVKGRTKVAKGSAITVPKIGPGLRRLPGGSIPTRKKAKNRDDLIKVEMSNGVTMLLEQQRKRKVIRYFLTKTARGTSRFSSFERDVYATARWSIPVRFRKEFDKAMLTAKKL